MTAAERHLALSRRALLALAGLGSLGALIGCGSDGHLVTADVGRRPADPSAAGAAVSAIGAFGIDLVAALPASENVVCSPYSILVALAMVRHGATGQTAQQFDEVLHLPKLTALDNGLNALDKALTARSGKRRDSSGGQATVTLDVANRVWGQRELVWEPAFLAALAEFYGTGIAEDDISGDPEGTRRAVNAWVAESTHDKIGELMPAGSITRDDRLVLANALYVRAPWHQRLQETDPRPFRSPGGPVDVPMLATTLPDAGVVGPGWTAARVPLAGQELALTVVLPEDDLPSLYRRLRGDGLARLLARQPKVTVDVSLPSLELRSRLSLVDLLVELGMPRAFQRDAEFDGLTRTEQLYLTAVQHEGWLALDEEGLEAAAATSVAAGTTSAVVADLELVLDRPYLACLHDIATGVPLLLVQVTDPSDVAS